MLLAFDEEYKTKWDTSAFTPGEWYVSAGDRNSEKGLYDLVKARFDRSLEH